MNVGALHPGMIGSLATPDAPEPLPPRREAPQAPEASAPAVESQVGGHLVHGTYDRELARPVNQIVDMNTREVIREFPSEELQRIAAKLNESMGLMFDNAG